LSKKSPMFRLGPLLLVFSFASTLQAFTVAGVPNRVIISVRDQKLMLLQNGGKVVTYPVSTSKFGVGDSSGRMTTPLGLLQVAKKIGDSAPPGAVFHNRRWTGEILKPNAPGRDPVITRIIWLRGLETQNAHAFKRCIYIHGTPEENTIGRPASYGCIRMKSHDVASLYNQVPLGAFVQIVSDRLPEPPDVKPSSAPDQVQNAEAETWTTSVRPSHKHAPNPPNKSADVAQNIPHA
jgi:lipoprotein-anchoring transpeptidase ErfK/SrfK